MTEQDTEIRSELSKHILPSSATMVGVCITALSIIKLAKLTGLAMWVSHLLALCSLIFLASALCSYSSMRSKNSARIERFADSAFLVGLTLLSLCAVLIAILIN